MNDTYIKATRDKKFDEELLNSISPLIGWCRKKYGSKYSEDITSDVILRALMWGKFDFSRGKMITWLVSMAINLYKQKFTEEKHHRFVELLEEHEDKSIYSVKSKEENSEDRVLFYLEKLNERDKKLIELTIEGKKVRNIAKIFNTSPENMKKHLYNARKKLKKEFHKVNF